MYYEDADSKREKRKEVHERGKMANSSYVNELRRELYDQPEEVHLGGMATQKTKFMKELDQIEKLELENMKRMNFSK